MAEVSEDMRDAEECELCEENQLSLLSWCSGCEMVLCETCWMDQPIHRKKLKFSNATKHEKTDLRVAALIRSILNGGRQATTIEAHEYNLSTKWFGVTTDNESSEKATFYSFDRFRSLLVYDTQVENAYQFPSITSFIGDTGAGKSTLINALMKTNAGDNTDQAHALPIMGQTTGTPMSGDVHLFPDPKSLPTIRPLLYCDCEGLDGGNNPAVGSLSKKLNDLRAMLPEQVSCKADENWKVSGYRKRDVQFAQNQDQSQQWIVNHLYPTILYTFSDVICFVTKNTRKIEHHISNLITWAEKAFDKSLNQPMLPYAIIAINALEPDTEDAESWWDVGFSTSTLSRLDSIVQDNHHNRRGPLPKLAERWRKQGKKIATLQDLLLCYYSGFKVVCIPHSSRPPALLHEQYQKLYQEIQVASKSSEERRKSVGLLMISEELDRYFEIGLEHFSQNPEAPFNFLSSALKYNPINPTFKDHVLNLFVYMSKNFPEWSESEVLGRTAPLVASCVFLDIFRKRYPYRGNSTLATERYISFCRESVELFRSRHWRCEEKDSHGNRCANVALGHSKGHQRLDGNIFGDGPFRSSYGSHGQKFLNNVRSRLDGLFKEQGECKQANEGPGDPEVRSAAEFHKSQTLSTITHFWMLHEVPKKDKSDLRMVSYHHSTCFCCLNDIPIHTLQCGHIICQNCVENYSESSNCGNFLCVSGCPLCYNINDPWVPTWKTKVKPPTAGLRILSLDGGGIRSIVQLSILQEIENSIGLGIPVRDFFDLIIGTSGGGIVAFGIGAQQLDVATCSKRFKELARKAFQIHKLGNVRLVGRFIEAHHNGKYKTRGLEEALKEVFGEAPIFGTNQNQENQHPTKVAVTTTSNNQSYLLANYNRPVRECSPPYEFFRATSQVSELKAWQALRATSAAPTYFKPFFYEPAGLEFIDGGMKYNNPIELANMERKCIWPEFEDCDPDILLSIGTGREKIPRARSEKLEKSEKTEKSEKSEKLEKRSRKIKTFRTYSYAKNLAQIVSDTIDNSLNSEEIWDRFSAAFLRSPVEDRHDNHRKYCRLNPKFDTVPSLDKADQMDELECSTAEMFANSPAVKNVASTLIASLFYLQEECRLNPIPGLQNLEKYNGTIFCRLVAGSSQLRTLCQRLLQQISKSPDSKNNVFYRQYWDKKREAVVFDPLWVDMELFKSMCSKIVSPLHESASPQAFELSVSFLITNASNKTRICLRVEDQYISAGQDEVSKYALISGFPRYLEWQQEQHMNPDKRPFLKHNPMRIRTSPPGAHSLRSNSSGETDSSSLRSVCDVVNRLGLDSQIQPQRLANLQGQNA